MDQVRMGWAEGQREAKWNLMSWMQLFEAKAAVLYFDEAWF
jgi:hypothetical protein